MTECLSTAAAPSNTRHMSVCGTFSGQKPSTTATTHAPHLTASWVGSCRWYAEQAATASTNAPAHAVACWLDKFTNCSCLLQTARQHLVMHMTHCPLTPPPCTHLLAVSPCLDPAALPPPPWQSTTASLCAAAQDCSWRPEATADVIETTALKPSMHACFVCQLPRQIAGSLDMVRAGTAWHSTAVLLNP